MKSVACDGAYEDVLRRSFTWRYAENQDVWTHEDALHKIGALAADVLDAIGGRRILDVGIGNGSAATGLLAAPDRTLTGLDIVRPSGWDDLAARYGDRIELVESGFLTWEPPAAPFDLVIDMGCYHHQAPDDHAAYLSRARTLTAPGGRLVLCVYGLEPDAPQPVARDETDHGRLSFHFTPEALRSRLEEAGFAVDRIHRVERPALEAHYLVAVAEPVAAGAR